MINTIYTETGKPEAPNHQMGDPREGERERGGEVEKNGGGGVCV